MGGGPQMGAMQQQQQGMAQQQAQGGPQQQMLFGQNMMGVSGQQPGGAGMMMMPQNAQGGQNPGGMQMPGQMFNMGATNQQGQVVMMPVMMAPGGQGFVPQQGNFMQQQMA